MGSNLNRTGRVAPSILAIAIGAQVLIAVAIFGTQNSVITGARSGGGRMILPTPFIDRQYPFRYPLLDLWDYPSCPPIGCLR